jgi:hypothetical protein
MYVKNDYKFIVDITLCGLFLFVVEQIKYRQIINTL